ncbi:MAG TPA: hypothetical protein VMF56_11260 [Acidobacteriaceae bacterium]|nr:hypothetical protein [Acidobacteriaceae bacterium]
MLVHVVQIGDLNKLRTYAGRSGFKYKPTMQSMMRNDGSIVRSTLQLVAKARLLPGQVYANRPANHASVQQN